MNTHFLSYGVDIVDTQVKYLRMRRNSEERQENKIISPMPGKVVKVAVQKGDRLEPGDIVVVIEAMKMQSNYKGKFGLHGTRCTGKRRGFGDEQPAAF